MTRWNQPRLWGCCEFLGPLCLFLPFPLLATCKSLDSIRRELNVTNYFRLLVSVENWNKTKPYTQTPVFVATHDALSCSYLDALHDPCCNSFLPSSETATVSVHHCVALCVVTVTEEGWHARSLHQPHTDCMRLSCSWLGIDSVLKPQPTVVCWRQLQILSLWEV